MPWEQITIELVNKESKKTSMRPDNTDYFSFEYQQCSFLPNHKMSEVVEKLPLESISFISVVHALANLNNSTQEKS